MAELLHLNCHDLDLTPFPYKEEAQNLIISSTNVYFPILNLKNSNHENKHYLFFLILGQV